MQHKDNKQIIKQKKLHPPHGRGNQITESHRASSDQKQGSESNKINEDEIDKEYELSSALLFQVNLAHSLDERRSTPALEKVLDQGSYKLITSSLVDYSKDSLLSRWEKDKDFNFWLPGDKELIKVIKKIIEKSFIRYKIGSYRSYRDLCIKREVIPEPYPEDSLTATQHRIGVRGPVLRVCGFQRIF